MVQVHENKLRVVYKQEPVGLRQQITSKYLLKLRNTLSLNWEILHSLISNDAQLLWTRHFRSKYMNDAPTRGGAPDKARFDETWLCGSWEPQYDKEIMTIMLKKCKLPHSQVNRTSFY